MYMVSIEREGDNVNNPIVTREFESLQDAANCFRKFREICLITDYPYLIDQYGNVLAYVSKSGITHSWTDAV